MVGIVVVDAKRGLHCGVRSLCWFCVSQGKVAGYRHKIKMKICKGRNKGWQEVCHKRGGLISC